MTFPALLEQATAGQQRFGHREHLHLTWLAVQAHGAAAAADLIDDGIRAAAPEKHHATVTRAWVSLVGFHVAEQPDAGFETLLRDNPALLDKQLLTRFYHPETLATPEAALGWVSPDKAPLP